MQILHGSATRDQAETIGATGGGQSAELPTPAYFVDFETDTGEPCRLRVREIVSIEGTPTGAIIEAVNQFRMRTIRTRTPARTLQEAHAAALALELEQAA